MTASLLIPPVFRAFDASGAPLAGGLVYTYEAGTLTLKPSYTDASGSTSNTNPVILDESGEANIWLNGNYKINLADSNNVQQPNYPVDNVTSNPSTNVYYVTTGTANNYILTPSPALTSYQNVYYYVQPNVDNTGPSTLNVSGLGAKNILKNGTTPLDPGDFLSSIIYPVVFDGINFQIISGLLSATLTGDVTGSGSGSIATTIANNAVSNAKMANMAANTVKANNTNSSDIPSDVALATNTVLLRAGGNITALSMGASTILARLASGDIVAATPTQITALITGIPAALCSLNGTGTPAFIKNSGFTSITDNGAGDYTVNSSAITTNSIIQLTMGDFGRTDVTYGIQAVAAGSVRTYTKIDDGAAVDVGYVSIVVWNI